MGVPSDNHKALARQFREQIVGDVCVKKYYDEDESHSIAILFSRQDGGVVAATIGLMDFDQSRRPDKQIACEVLLDSREDASDIGNILSTVAFYVMKDGWRLSPGKVFEDMVSMYRPDSQLPHLYLTAPFQWGETLTRVNLSDMSVYPLLAIPISSSERDLVKHKGGDALESLWESSSVDVLNWKRGGVAYRKR